MRYFFLVHENASGALVSAWKPTERAFRVASFPSNAKPPGEREGTEEQTGRERENQEKEEGERERERERKRETTDTPHQKFFYGRLFTPK